MKARLFEIIEERMYPLIEEERIQQYQLEKDKIIESSYSDCLTMSIINALCENKGINPKEYSVSAMMT